MGEISITKLLVVAALIILVFGTKKLRTLGGDQRVFFCLRLAAGGLRKQPERSGRHGK